MKKVNGSVVPSSANGYKRFIKPVTLILDHTHLQALGESLGAGASKYNPEHIYYLSRCAQAHRFIKRILNPGRPQHVEAVHVRLVCSWEDPYAGKIYKMQYVHPAGAVEEFGVSRHCLIRAGVIKEDTRKFRRKRQQHDRIAA